MFMEGFDSSSLSMAALIQLLLRNLIAPVFVSAEKSIFLSLSYKSKLFHLLQWLLLSLFFVLGHLFRSLVPFSLSSHNYKAANHDIADHDHKAAGESGIGRALHQLLSLVNETPVSSRKYDVVRSLAEKLIYQNLNEDSPVLREVNCAVLSAAFSRTMALLEAAMLDGSSVNWFRVRPGMGEYRLGRAVRAVKGWGMAAGLRSGANEDGVSAEKMAEELVWLVEKLESRRVEVVMEKWAWASSLGWKALKAEPRVQASLVKLTAKDMGKKQDPEGRLTEQQKEIKLKLLVTWLPLLCRAGNVAAAPTLSSSEREEIQRALEGIIDKLEEAESQEKVLSLWLHHFIQCPSSDWPNLYGSYIWWCTTSRKLLLAQ